MAGCYIEERFITKAPPISWDIAHHLYARQFSGISIIVNSRPDGMLSAVTKQWYKIVRQVEHERASTLTATRIQELTYAVTVMQRTRFRTITTEPLENGEVFFLDYDSLTTIPENCHTVYITDPLQERDVKQLEAKMPLNSLLVIYKPRT